MCLLQKKLNGLFGPGVPILRAMDWYWSGPARNWATQQEVSLNNALESYWKLPHHLRKNCLHKNGPWCQKGWGLLFWPTQCVYLFIHYWVLLYTVLCWGQKNKDIAPTLRGLTVIQRKTDIETNNCRILWVCVMTVVAQKREWLTLLGIIKEDAWVSSWGNVWIQYIVPEAGKSGLVKWKDTQSLGGIKQYGLFGEL